MYIKDLTNLSGVSGAEDEVRDYIKETIKGKVDKLDVDTMGNIIAFKKGKKSNLKVMLAAHMDEVGFMVTSIGDMGAVKFKSVGGIDNRILAGKRVLIGENKVKGVIGIKPIHQQERAERAAGLDIKKLFIDIGSDKKEETEKKIDLGDFISFDSDYEEFGEGFIKAKALDDRVGCSLLMELLDMNFDFDLYACFTVQEEVGLRGAKIAGYAVDPDIAIVLEGTTSNDLPEVDEHEKSTILGNGPVLTFMDKSSIADKDLNAYIEKCGQRKGVKYQYKHTVSGGNDAGSIQRNKKGVKVAVVAVPLRYIHTDVSVMKKSDYEDFKTLMIEALEGLDKI